MEDIVAAAEARAAEIEAAALARAAAIEQAAERRASVRDAVFAGRTQNTGRHMAERVARLAETASQLDERAGAVLAALRADAELVAHGLHAASPPPEDTAARPGDAGPAGSTPPPNRVTATPPRTGVAPTPRAAAASPDVMDLMRRHVVRLRDSGKSRAEAADSLMSFKKGPSYLPLLDEVYSGDAPNGPPAAPARRWPGPARA